MITFNFNPMDVDEESREFYHETYVAKEGMEDATISEVISLFKDFLRGMGYAEESINEYITGIDS